MRKQILTLALAATLGLAAVYAYADDEMPALSYAQDAPDEKVQARLDGLIAWAKGELAEHVGEGLFNGHSEEKRLIQGMIDWAEELRRQAAAASKRGDHNTARIRLFSAEATARYAALMPHLLEDRLGHEDEDD